MVWKFGNRVVLGHSDINALILGKCPRGWFSKMKRRYHDMWEADYPGDLDDCYLILYWNNGIVFDIEEGVTFMRGWER